jgi:aminoglycoside 6-adenylyltransferase
MRNETEIRNLITDFAQYDNRIRAVLLNGSRANPKLIPDRLQDFDIVFIVDNLKSFTSDHTWTNIFGEKIISQLPDDMTFGKDYNKEESIDFHYLMLFNDGNRIDLTLFPKENFKSDFKSDSLTILWVDKDNLFSKIPQSSDKNYHISKPTEKEFSDTCNEFWWVSTYVAKGLLRDEITYSKDMLETVVRPMFMKVIEWKVGIENDFNVSFGKAGKYMKAYLPNEFYTKVLRTYSNFETEENWKALFLLTEIFKETSNYVAQKLNFSIDRTEVQNVISYLRKQYNETENYT